MLPIRVAGIVPALLLGLWAAHVGQAAEPAVLEAQQRRVTVIEKVAPTVVAIFARGGAGGGSGVLITPDGYVLTNYHVVASSGGYMQCGLNDGKVYDAVIVGIDPTGDVAMIKLLGRTDFPHAVLGDSDQVKVGDWAYAMGNPFLLATDFQPTVTYGIVSGVHRYQYPAGTFLEYTDCIQVDTSINPGNSGGPLFNDQGELVGINGRGSFEKRGRVNSGAGYAISINQIKHFMDRLRSGRVVDHGSLGATVTTEADGSVVVSNILEQSEVYRRGLRYNDEIVSFAGRTIRSVNQFKNILGIYPKGWKLPLVYRRDQEKHQIYARLRGLHRESELMFGSQPNRPERPLPQPERPGEPPKTSPHQPKAEIPEQYRDMLIRRPGFANYYFNQLEQKRVLRGLNALGDFSPLTGKWSITGKTGDGKPFEFTLTDAGLGLEFGDGIFLQQLDGSELLDEPAETGGLLVAMHYWKRLLTKGASGFSDFYYLGSEPLDGHGPRVDVIVAEESGVESHWYFDHEDATLLGFDTWRSEDVDPCEIRTEGFRDFDGRRLPDRFVVQHATKEYATFEVEQVDLQPGVDQRDNAADTGTEPQEPASDSKDQ